MGFVHRAFVAVGAGLAVSVIAGCGSSGGSLLTASESRSLSEQLNRVTQALDDQRCSQARQYLADFRSNVDSLGGVDSTLIANLDQGASTIQTLTARDCQTPTNTTPKKTHPKTTTSTTTTATRTTQTFTTPTTATYTQPAYTQPTTPSNGGIGLGGGDTTTTATTQSTTTSNGGTGLGGGQTSTGGATTTGTGTGTGAVGGGF